VTDSATALAEADNVRVDHEAMNLDPAHHALITLLWSEEPDDEAYELEDVSPELRQQLSTEWGQFRELLESLGFDPERDRATYYDSSQGDAWCYAAHDWILTRNHHGAGFWDGGWHQPWACDLTLFCHQRSPEIHVCRGDDGLLYCC
jgi:hypothetical protein